MTENIQKERFNDHEIHVIQFRGQSCFIVQEVGIALGYKEGRYLAQKVTNEWAHEFKEGVDYFKVVGPELQALKHAYDESSYGSPFSPKTSQVLLLTKEGVWGACIKAEPAPGAAFRLWLKSEVLPAIENEGAYFLEPQKPAISPELQLKIDREDRLTRQGKSRELRSLITLLHKKYNLPDEVALVYLIEAAEITTGRNLNQLKPAPPDGVWKAPTEIGEQFNVHRNIVGRAISHLGLRGTKHERKIMSKKEHCDGIVECFLWDAEAVDMIEKYLLATGKIRRLALPPGEEDDEEDEGDV